MANIIEFFKDLIFKDPLSLEKILVIVSLIGSFYGFVRFVRKVVIGTFNIFNRKSLYDKLKPYFSKNEIRRALENYIPTQCQNVDPAQETEPARSHAFTVRQKLIPFFIKTLATLESPQTTFVTPITSMPFEPYKSFNVFALYAIFSRFISILGVAISRLHFFAVPEKNLITF
jgi:hypothetical protein